MPRKLYAEVFSLYYYFQERGAEKERKFLLELMKKQREEERVRVLKANLYSYTTDYRVVHIQLVNINILISIHVMIVTWGQFGCRFLQNQSPNHAHNLSSWRVE